MAVSLSVTDKDMGFHSVGIFEKTTLQDNTSPEHVVQNPSLRTDCIFARFNESQYLPWDNPDNIVSQEVDIFSNKIKDLVVAFAFLIGGPANVINMAVFFKQGLQDRVNLCLFMLAVSDEIYTLFTLLLHAENIYYHFISVEVIATGNKFMTNNNIVIFSGSGFISVIMSAIIAFERCYCVLRPLKYQTLLRTRTMAFIIFSIFVCVYGLYFIVVYRYWIGCVFDPVTGVVSLRNTGGGLYITHKQLIDLMDSVLFGAVLSGGSMVVVTTATIITSVKLRQIVIWRSESSSTLSPREVALTKMLIGNSIFFIICISPPCLFRFVCFFMPEMSAGGRYHNFYLTTVHVLEGTTFINSSFNIFIYYAMGSRYRETFWALFSRKRYNKEGEK